MLWLLGALNVLGAIAAIAVSGWSGLAMRSLIILGLGTIVSVCLPVVAQRHWRYTMLVAWALALLYVFSRLIVTGGDWHEAFRLTTLGQQLAFAVMTIVAALATRMKTHSSTQTT